MTYPCDLCDYVAARPEALKRHKKSKHEEKKFPCDQCQFRAHSAIKLSQHKLTAHVGVRYPCNMCDFTAPKPAKLKERSIFLTYEKVYSCLNIYFECLKMFFDFFGFRYKVVMSFKFPLPKVLLWSNNLHQHQVVIYVNDSS